MQPLKLVLASVTATRGMAAEFRRLMTPIREVIESNKMNAKIIVLLSPPRSDTLGLWLAQNEFFEKESQNGHNFVVNKYYAPDGDYILRKL